MGFKVGLFELLIIFIQYSSWFGWQIKLCLSKMDMNASDFVCISSKEEHKPKTSWD